MESPAPLSDFEVRLKELQAAVAKLEGGELTLEEAFAEWEAGCASYGACHAILSSAKARVEVLASRCRDETSEWELFEGADFQISAEGAGGRGEQRSGAGVPGGAYPGDEN